MLHQTLQLLLYVRLVFLPDDAAQVVSCRVEPLLSGFLQEENTKTTNNERQRGFKLVPDEGFSPPLNLKTAEGIKLILAVILRLVTKPDPGFSPMLRTFSLSVTSVFVVGGQVLPHQLNLWSLLLLFCNSIHKNLVQLSKK